MLTHCIHILWQIDVYTVNVWIGTEYLVMQLYEKVNANFEKAL